MIVSDDNISQLNETTRPKAKLAAGGWNLNMKAWVEKSKKKDTPSTISSSLDSMQSLPALGLVVGSFSNSAVNSETVQFSGAGISRPGPVEGPVDNLAPTSSLCSREGLMPALTAESKSMSGSGSEPIIGREDSGSLNYLPRQSSYSSSDSHSQSGSGSDKGSNVMAIAVTMHNSSLVKCLILWAVLLLLTAVNLGHDVHSHNETLTNSVSNIEQQASIDDFGEPIVISFRNLSVTRTVGSTTLTTVRPLSGSLLPGHLTAIMGGSGSGKSTLLRALMNRLDSSESRHGILAVNGQQQSDLSNTLKSRVGFVPQDDVMHDGLSVEKNLLFSAEWRLKGKTFTAPARRGIVRDILSRLGLSAIKNLRVGKGSDTTLSHISGGQKKRVSIGMELCADPAVLFLDEPTSGLDSTTTKQIIAELATASRNASITMAAVLHQPSDEAFGMFERLILLARGGAALYVGPTADAVPYFAERGFAVHLPNYCNRADFLMDIVEGVLLPANCSASHTSWCTNYQPIETPYRWWTEDCGKGDAEEVSSITTSPSSEVSRNHINEEHASFHDATNSCISSESTPFKQQWSLLLYRSSLLLLSSWSIADLGIVSFVAIMVAVFRREQIQRYGPNLTSASLGNRALAMGISMIAIVQAIPDFDSERLTLQREIGVGLNIGAFAAAKFATSIYVVAITPFIFVLVYALVLHISQRLVAIVPEAIGNEMSPVHLEPLPRSVNSFPAVCTLYWSLVLICFTASSYGWLISMLAPPESAMLTGVLTIIFINLVPDINQKLGELSFMHALSLWVIKIDASPLEASRTRKQIIKLALLQFSNAENVGGNVGTALENMLPRLQSDVQILRSLSIENTCQWEFERALVISAIFARLVGFSVMLRHGGITVVFLFVFMIIWLRGGLALSKQSQLNVPDSGLVDIKKDLEKLNSKGEAALLGIEESVKRNYRKLF